MASANLFAGDSAISDKIAKVMSGVKVKTQGGLGAGGASVPTSQQQPQTGTPSQKGDETGLDRIKGITEKFFGAGGLSTLRDRIGRDRGSNGGGNNGGGSGSGGTGTGTSTAKPLNDGTLAGRVAELTASGSPLMRQAATAGQQELNRRGLGNSSMAVGAAQGKMIEAATPIASQEFADKKERDLAAQRLAAEKEAAAAQRAHETSLEASRQASQKTLAEMELAGKERAEIAGAITQAAAARAQALSNTLANDKIPAAERAKIQQQINAQHDGTMSYIQSLYGVQINVPTSTPTTTPSPTLPQITGGGKMASSK